MLQACHIPFNVPGFPEHKYVSILYGIPADQHPVLNVQDRNTARRVPRVINNLQRTVTQVDDIPLFYRDHPGSYI